MRRIYSSKTYELFGVEGTGRTVAAAKADAEQRLERYVQFADTFRLHYVYVSGRLSVIYRDVNGNTVTETPFDCGELRRVPGSSTSGDSIDEAIAYAFLHNLTQEDTFLDDSDPAWLQVPEKLRPATQQEARRQIAWRAAYNSAKQEQQSDSEAFRSADLNWPRFVPSATQQDARKGT